MLSLLRAEGSCIDAGFSWRRRCASGGACCDQLSWPVWSGMALWCLKTFCRSRSLRPCATRSRPWWLAPHACIRHRTTAGLAFDGGTLNRFLHIDPEQMPRAAAFSHDQRLSAGSRQVIGLPMNPRKLDIYLTVHGEETRLAQQTGPLGGAGLHGGSITRNACPTAERMGA